jgi:hypothetical protein
VKKDGRRENKMADQRISASNRITTLDWCLLNGLQPNKTFFRSRTCTKKYQISVDSMDKR